MCDHYRREFRIARYLAAAPPSVKEPEKLSPEIIPQPIRVRVCCAVSGCEPEFLDEVNERELRLYENVRRIFIEAATRSCLSEVGIVHPDLTSTRIHPRARNG